MPSLEFVDYSRKPTVHDGRQVGRIRTPWKTLEDNSKDKSRLSEEDESKATGFNLMEGQERKEYMLDAQNVDDSHRKELEKADQRGDGYQKQISVPEGDEWHREYQQDAAQYRPEQRAMIDEQAKPRRTQRVREAWMDREAAAMSKELSGLGRLASATIAREDNGTVEQAKEALTSSTVTHEEREAALRAAQRSVEDAQADMQH